MDLGRNRFRETDALTEHSLRYRFDSIPSRAHSQFSLGVVNKLKRNLGIGFVALKANHVRGNFCQLVFTLLTLGASQGNLHGLDRQMKPRQNHKIIPIACRQQALKICKSLQRNLHLHPRLLHLDHPLQKGSRFR